MSDGRIKKWQRTRRDGLHHPDKRPIAAYLWKEIKDEAKSVADQDGISLADHIERSIRLGNRVFTIRELEEKRKEERMTPEDLVYDILTTVLPKI